jgi:hypothetical protein
MKPSGPGAGRSIRHIAVPACFESRPPAVAGAGCRLQVAGAGQTVENGGHSVWCIHPYSAPRLAGIGCNSRYGAEDREGSKSSLVF